MSELPPAPDDPGPVETEPGKKSSQSVRGLAIVVVVFVVGSFAFGWLTGLGMAPEPRDPTPVQYALDEDRSDCVRHINGRLLEAGVTDLVMLKQMAEGSGLEEAKVTVIPHRDPSLEYVIVTGWYCR